MKKSVKQCSLYHTETFVSNNFIYDTKTLAEITGYSHRGIQLYNGSKLIKGVHYSETYRGKKLVRYYNQTAVEVLSKTPEKIICDNKELFKEMILPYYEKIKRYLNSRVGNLETAKDLTQDVFEKALHMFKPEIAEYPLQWLYRIAKYEWQNYLNTKSETIAENFQIDTLRVNFDYSETPEKLKTAVNKLSDIDTVIMYLFFVNETPTQVIGIMLNKNTRFISHRIKNIKGILSGAFNVSGFKKNNVNSDKGKAIPELIFSNHIGSFFAEKHHIPNEFLT